MGKLSRCDRTIVIDRLGAPAAIVLSRMSLPLIHDRDLHEPTCCAFHTSNRQSGLPD